MLDVRSGMKLSQIKGQTGKSAPWVRVPATAMTVMNMADVNAGVCEQSAEM
jgi:hypothetical protein